MFERVLQATRRRWWFIVLATALGAIVGAWSGSSTYTASATLVVLDSSSGLSAVGLPVDLIDRAVSLRAEADKLGTDEVEAQISDEVGSEVKGLVAVDAAAKGLRFTVEAKKEDVADRALTSYLDAAKTQRIELVTSVTDELASGFQTQRESIRARIDELDALIAPLGSDRVSLSDAYRVERTRRADDLVGLDLEAAAVDDYARLTEASFRIIDRPATASASAGKVGSGVLGAIVGLFLGLACVAGATAVDRRVRTATDLGGFASSVPVYEVAGKHAPAAVAALVASLESTKVRDFLIVGDEQRVADGLVALLDAKIAAAGADLRGVPVAYPADPDSVLQARSIKTMVVALRAGRTHASAIPAMVAPFEAAGVAVVGYVIVEDPSEARRPSSV